MDHLNSRFGSQSGPNVSAAAQGGSHITAPVLTNNTITGNVHIIHNAPGFTYDRPHSESPQTSETRSRLIFKHKTRICSENQYVTEYNSLPGEQVLLSERYTQPLILQRYRDQQEREEELRSSGEDFQQVLSSRSGDESSHLNSLFNPDNHGISPSAVILQGNSGNGKTLTVQKIMLDWASDKLYKERFDIVFHLKCKEINRIPGRKSLVEILSYSCSLTSDEISQILQQSPKKMLFIIDGFDELRLTQDINYMSHHTDVIQKASPEVTLCALLKGHIMPESFLLVTSRSTATDTLSKLLKGPQCFSEIMGFSEKGVEEYFQKFFQDEELFRRAYTFVKANENLFTACSIPVICWIICTTIKERFRIGADVTSGLETTTSIYVDFVSTLLKHHCQGQKQSVPSLLMSLGKLAERGMLEQQVLLDENTVYETISDPAANPFLCKFLFKRRICQETMFSFMHLSFQEFFTALYYVILDEEESKRKLTELISINDGEHARYPPRYAAVVQFACGLLNKDVQQTLRKSLCLLVHPNTQALLKEWILKEVQSGIYHDRTLFILHCLYELHEEDVVIKAIKSWKSINAYGSFFRRTDCWALLYCSQCCQCIQELSLGSCRLTSEKLMMILPALPKFKKLTLHLADPSVSALVELMCALTRGQNLNLQEVHVVSEFSISFSPRSEMSIGKELSRISVEPLCYGPARSLQILVLTVPHSELKNINWTNFFQLVFQKDSEAFMLIPCCFSKLNKMEIRTDCLSERLTVWALQIIQNCSSLTEVKLDAYFLLEEGLKILQRSCTRPACVVRVEGFVCHKQSQKCTHYEDRQLSCNQKVVIHLSSQGFSMETLRKSLF